MRIYVNGFMGSGKSTVGPLLARTLNWPFLDLDEQIEARIGMPIASFFSAEGEPAFRAIERDELQRTAETGACVVAVGGGALCSDETLTFALENGVVVYLAVSVDELVRRLKAEQATRPMLLSTKGDLLPDATVRDRINALLERRLSFYTQAHITIQTDGMWPKAIASDLVSKLTTAGFIKG